jgi:hypothetical protein
MSPKPSELKERFGPEAAGLVSELTDDKSLKKGEHRGLRRAYSLSFG